MNRVHNSLRESSRNCCIMTRKIFSTPKMETSTDQRDKSLQKVSPQTASITVTSEIRRNSTKAFFLWLASAASYKNIRNTEKPLKKAISWSRLPLYLNFKHSLYYSHRILLGHLCSHLHFPTCQLNPQLGPPNLASKLDGLITALQMTGILLNEAISVQGKEFIRHVTGETATPCLEGRKLFKSASPSPLPHISGKRSKSLKPPQVEMKWGEQRELISLSLLC